MALAPGIDPRDLPERPTVAPSTPPPAGGHCSRNPEFPPPVRWHQLEITSTSPEGDAVTRRAEGDDAWVAASLRALADQLDPPRPPRPTLRGPDPVVGMVQGARQPVAPRGMVALPPPSDGPRHDPMSLP